MTSIGLDTGKIGIRGDKTVTECHRINCGVFQLMIKVICHFSTAREQFSGNWKYSAFNELDSISNRHDSNVCTFISIFA
jgi:hypothetical protein